MALMSMKVGVSIRAPQRQRHNVSIAALASQPSLPVEAEGATFCSDLISRTRRSESAQVQQKSSEMLQTATTLTFNAQHAGTLLALLIPPDNLDNSPISGPDLCSLNRG